jgi:hypothetical protein
MLKNIRSGKLDDVENENVLTFIAPKDESTEPSDQKINELEIASNIVATSTPQKQSGVHLLLSLSTKNHNLGDCNYYTVISIIIAISNKNMQYATYLLNFQIIFNTFPLNTVSLVRVTKNTLHRNW